MKTDTNNIVTIPVIVIYAPTATGKTALILKLFGKGSHSFFNGKAELISADSMQVYRGMNIGTAKPSTEEQNELPHHLIDVCDINEQFSVAEFVERADDLCSEIYAKGKIPVIAGGTGFYIRNFILGLPKTPESNPLIREKLKNRLEQEGSEVLYQELQNVDPDSARKIHINDSYRILRALEVFYSTGKPRSFFEMNNNHRSKYKFLILVPERNRTDLYERINMRVEQMFADGLEAEVKKLIADGAKVSDPGMQAIGYREWFFNSDIDVIKEEIKKNSRRYAKKQYTYIKGIENACIIEFDSEKELIDIVAKKIENFI